MAEENKEFTGIRTNTDLRDVSFVLRNLFRTGSLSAVEILQEAGNMLPKFRAILHAGAGRIASRGLRLSLALEGLFPPNALPAIVAGEESGRLAQVFDQMFNAAKVQEEINKVLRGLLMPLILIGLGVVVSLCFFIFLIPKVYSGLAKGTPQSYDPGLAIKAAVATNAWIMDNWQLTLLGVLISAMAAVGFFSKPSVQDWMSDLAVRWIIKVRPVGEAYANLKFGVMAQYLQIVSLAGLDADRRIDLVIDVLPEALRGGIKAFRSEFLVKSIKVAAQSEGRPESDPRTDTILWPPYVRLAFLQAHEGNWEEPMHEFGSVMLEDGKERIKRHIATLQTLSFIIVGLLLIIPVGLLYGTMGEIMTMRLRML